MDHLRDVPVLHTALQSLMQSHVRLPAPPDSDGQPRYWIHCENCKSVTAVPCRVVSTICEDCMAPCPHVDCGLLIHEHHCGCEPELKRT